MYKNVSCRLTFQSRIKIPKMSEYFSILIYLLCFLKAKFMKQSQRCFIPRLHQTVNSSKIKIRETAGQENAKKQSLRLRFHIVTCPILRTYSYYTDIYLRPIPPR